MIVTALSPKILPRGLVPVAAAALAACALVSGGCASSGASAGSGNAALPPITKPADLLGTKWTLPMTEGGRDGRTIEFRYGDDKRIHAILTKVGFQLDKVVGAREGADIMELVPDGSQLIYRGTERIPGKELEEVRCSVSASGRELKCTTANWPWVRVS